MYSMYSVYTYVYLYLHVMFLNSFSKPFLRGTPQRIWSVVSSLGILTPFLSLYVPVLVIAGTLLIVNYWLLAPSEGFHSRSQRPFDRAQLLYV